MLKRHDKILYEALLEKGITSKEILRPILKEIEATGEGFQDVLVKRNIAAEKDILKLISEKMKISCIELKNAPIDESLTKKIPIKVASYYKFVPISIKGTVLTVAVASPLDIKTQDEIRTQLGYEIDMVLSCRDDIAEHLKKYYGLAADTVDKITSQPPDEEVPPASEGMASVEDIEKLAGDASVIKLVNQIIVEGWRKRATDIHIEPYREGVSLRYRIDGVLYSANVPPEMKKFLSAIISRVKIMSNLNIVERRMPQDGRTVVKVQEQVLDLRISTVPTPFGESVVIRILPTKMLFSLEKLGLSKNEIKIFEELIQKPHGIIFVTGPTGSGKTTTLYAALNRINTKDRKIITIEDPIEYEMPGIVQMQVMPEIGLDFARSLRSILRHDPDVIMVGEVRDLETAEVAIRIALTGHLIFSTLHTNDAASGIARLIDIGVEPYLVASSVEAFIAQRLIRLICPECKFEDKKAPAELKAEIARDCGLRSPNKVRIFRGKGCGACNFTGFFGRTGIYEILLIDEAMKDLIIKKTPSSVIKKIAVSKVMKTLRHDGWQKVLEGLTTPEEVMKVTAAEEKTPVDLYRPSGAVEALRPEEWERRIYPRLSSNMNVTYKIIESEAEISRRGLGPEQLSITKNISAGGLLFVGDEPLKVGAIMELKMELPDGGEPVECLAKVVRVEQIEDEGPYDIGVCFLDITSAQRARLDKYVDKRIRG